MHIEIWSDIVCPFCYIGKRKFEAALERFAAREQVTIRWRSFQLDPDAQTDPGTSVVQSLSQKKGWSMEQTEAMMEQVTMMAREVGLEYRMDKAVTANTLHAHRLTHLAAQYSKQDEAEEKLFEAYFTRGTNIGDIGVLEQVALELGLPEAEVKETLEGNRFADAVRRDQLDAQQVGVRGVPFFVFNNKYAVSGAQPSEVFAQVLQKVYEEEQPIALSVEGGFCTPGGECQ